MAQTASTMLPLGTLAPPFDLPEPATGQRVSLEHLSYAPALLIMVICNHCPFVKHIRQGLINLAHDYQPRGLAIVAISANDADNYPDDSPEKIAEEVKNFGYPFPYLYDESQAVAKAYQAACTPDFFLFDAQRKLVYRGQFDDSRPGNNIPVTGADLRAAADAVLAGQPVAAKQKPSIGCNIKWKASNAPDYYR
ncbi:MAG: thioredoxin family protein [Candidatus Contendobacter odensis]|uniref:Thioredoxin family protein n=1 Tax=Candidatus Contendibacter odensensis TaxID=1400860 RepID=A0A2G6PEV3_9GAMM|nr:MAG: thioredoxin family protein [Candidatus Contendobacter odensis]